MLIAKFAGAAKACGRRLLASVVSANGLICLPLIEAAFNHAKGHHWTPVGTMPLK